MIYSNTQGNVRMASTWQCDFDALGYGVEWFISSPPSLGYAYTTFDVSLPFDAVIKRIWLTMDVGSPLTGAALRKVNDFVIPSSGEVDLGIDALTAGDTSYTVVFTFKANGKVFEDLEQHTATLILTSPTLNIEYTSVSSPDDEEEQQPVIVSGGGGVRLPRLLGDGFIEAARLEPVSMRLEINLDPKSLAIMKLTEDQPAVKIGDFMELYSPHGSAGVFRVYEMQTHYGRGNMTRTVYLEHAISTLEDSLAIGAQTMYTPVRTVFATLLETQNVKHWVMGDCDVPEDYELIYEYSYDNLLAAVTKLTAELPPEYMWVFDTTRYPFVMHLKKLPDEDSGCEGRLSRNLASATVTIDRTSLCTRLIPFGAGENQDRVTLTSLIGSQHIDSSTAETWGLVSRTWTAEDIYDALTLKDVAERYLEKYGNPMVSITMDAIDLSEATGESIDSFAVGTLCRMALPDYGIVMNERVISLVWPEVYRRPEDVDVTLANRIRDASDEIADLMREATSAKLLGGKVETVEETANYSGITSASPYAHYFDVTGYGNLINVKTNYKCTTSAGVDMECTIVVDGNTVDSKDAVTRTVDITRYLQKDENGVPVVGEHRAVFFPNASSSTSCSIKNVITIKQINKG